MVRERWISAREALDRRTIRQDVARLLSRNRSARERHHRPHV